jgi:hypothetical protein
VKAEWPLQPLWGLRVRALAGSPAEWCIHDLMLFSGAYCIYNSPQWRLRASTNIWQLPLAFDENQATRWRTWRPIRRGDYVEVTFDRAQLLSAAVMTSHTPQFPVPFEFYGRGGNGWYRLDRRPQIVKMPPPDLRMDASRALRAAGFRYLLTPHSGDGNAPLGAAIAAHVADWNLEVAAQAGRVTLFRIR